MRGPGTRDQRTCPPRRNRQSDPPRDLTDLDPLFSKVGCGLSLKRTMVRVGQPIGRAVPCIRHDAPLGLGEARNETDQTLPLTIALGRILEHVDKFSGRP